MTPNSNLRKDKSPTENLSNNHILQQNRSAHCYYYYYCYYYYICCLFRASNVVWHCTSTRQRQIPCSKPHHTVPRQQHWPSMSPDVNPNKHNWNELQRRVRGRGNAPANEQELFQALKQEWVAIPAQVIRNLIQSLPKRCRAVIDSRGGHTPY